MQRADSLGHAERPGAGPARVGQQAQRALPAGESIEQLTRSNIEAILQLERERQVLLHEFAEVEAQLALVRRAVQHARTGRGEGYRGNPLLDPVSERSHNR